MTKAEDIVKDEEYQYGFHDDIQPEFSTGRGLTEEVVRRISAEKHEPKWMLDYRLKAYQIYKKMPMPDFGPDLSDLDLDYMLIKNILRKSIVIGTMCQMKLRKLLNVWVFLKPKENIWLDLVHSMNQKWFITI